VSGAYRASNMLPARRVRGIYRVEHAPCTTCTWHIRRAMRLLRAVVLGGCEAEVGGGLGTTPPHADRIGYDGACSRVVRRRSTTRCGCCAAPPLAPRSLTGVLARLSMGAKGGEDRFLTPWCLNASRRRGASLWFVVSRRGAGPWSLLGVVVTRRIAASQRKEERSWPPFAPTPLSGADLWCCGALEGGRAKTSTVVTPQWTARERAPSHPRWSKWGGTPNPHLTASSHPRSPTTRSAREWSRTFVLEKPMQGELGAVHTSPEPPREAVTRPGRCWRGAWGRRAGTGRPRGRWVSGTGWR
jgi:hypothetical protein